MRFRHLLLLAFSLFATASLSAQNPVKWAFTAKDAGNCQVDLIFTANIEDGWCTYSQFLESEDGPIPITLTFQQTPGFQLIVKAK